MAGNSVKRKQSKIFAAVVEGYSELISLDEEAKLYTLGECSKIIGSKIARRIDATLTPHSAVLRGALHVNSSRTRPR